MSTVLEEFVKTELIDIMDLLPEKQKLGSPFI